MSSTNHIDQVKAQLRPRFLRVLRQLADEGEFNGIGFFTEALELLDSAEDEEGLIHMCINLSRAAFVGIAYSDTSWQLTDELLEDAQNIAHAFTADGSEPH